MASEAVGEARAGLSEAIDSLARASAGKDVWYHTWKAYSMLEMSILTLKLLLGEDILLHQGRKERVEEEPAPLMTAAHDMLSRGRTEEALATMRRARDGLMTRMKKMQRDARR